MTGWRRHFEGYWQERAHGEHRDRSEAALEAEARAQLLLLEGGRSLVDFGCGAAEGLAYVAPAFAEVVGVDFSAEMLRSARERLDAAGLQRVRLVEADDRTVWERAPGHWDRVSAVGVVQFLRPADLRRFLEGARTNLGDSGRVVLFDIIDPVLFALWTSGAYRRSNPAVSLGLALARTMPRLVRRRFRRLRGIPETDIGREYSRREIEGMAHLAGFDCRCVSSMYYEYKFHAILTVR